MSSFHDQRVAARLAVPYPIPISVAIAAQERPSEPNLEAPLRTVYAFRHGFIVGGFNLASL